MKARTASLLLVLTAACASDPLHIPEDLPRSRAAVVRAWSPSPGDAEVRLQAVDGTEVGTVPYVLVAAGERRLTWRWSNTKGVTRVGQLRAELQAGRSYLVEAAPDGALRTILFGMVDKGSDYEEECLYQKFFDSRSGKGRNC